MSTPLRYRRPHPAPPQAVRPHPGGPLQADPTSPTGSPYIAGSPHIASPYAHTGRVAYVASPPPSATKRPNNEHAHAYAPAQPQAFETPRAAKVSAHPTTRTSHQSATPSSSPYTSATANSAPRLSAKSNSGGSLDSASSTPSPSSPTRVNRAERAERFRGRVLDDFKPNQSSIDKLIAATRLEPASPLSSPHGASRAAVSRYSVPIRLPTRQVSKEVDATVTVAALAEQLVREHRLEFEFDHNMDDDDSILLWECFEGTRRPLRDTESVVSIVRRWAGRSKYYLRTTSTSLRDDVDSLASLVPRRDMLRTPPTIAAADVNFSRPSVMYNPLNQPGQEQRRPSQPEDDSGSSNSSGSLARMPSKLNPSDKMLRVKRVQGDSEDTALQTQLVWGFGSLDLMNGRVVLKQKPGDELVCSMETAGAEVYEWPYQGPKKYVVVLKTQQAHSQAVYISTDSAKVFSLLRNAVFTARSRALMYQKLAV